MKENITGVGLNVRNANKKKIPLEFLMPILRISKEEVKKMYPKNSSSAMCRKSNGGAMASPVAK